MSAPQTCEGPAGTDPRHETETASEPKSTDDPNALQFRDRRRFIVWAVLAGFCSPDRLTEAVIADVEAEALP